MTPKRKAQIAAWQAAGAASRRKPRGKKRWRGERPVVQWNHDLYHWDLKRGKFVRNLYENGWGKNTPLVPTSPSDPATNPLNAIKTYDAHIRKLVRRSLDFERAHPTSKPRRLI